MTTLIDLAGGTIGGAGRFREQFLQNCDPACAIGMEERMTPSWLARREWVARGADKVIAANNASFVLAGATRWVLARNANHFLSPQEVERSSTALSRGFKAQIPVIRALMRRADVVVAPSRSMAERIVTCVPSVAERVQVRFHPLAPVGGGLRDRDALFVPVAPAPYKRMEERMTALQLALDQAGLQTAVTASLPEDEMPEAIRGDERFIYAGHVDRSAIDDAYRHVRALYYPTDVESFGYPLAEARVNGLPIIAVDNDHNREVAGPALCGYAEGDPDSLAAAVQRALQMELEPDPQPFSPAEYFRWLMA